MIACSAFSFAFQMDAAKEADNKCKYAQLVIIFKSKVGILLNRQLSDMKMQI